MNEWISKSTNQLNKQKSTTNIHSNGDPQKGHKNQLKEQIAKIGTIWTKNKQDKIRL